jgi:hypothetical protein
MTSRWLAEELGVGSTPSLKRQPNLTLQTVRSMEDISTSLLCSMNFNVWKTPEDQLLLFLFQMFRNFDLLNIFNIPEVKLR